MVELPKSYKAGIVQKPNNPVVITEVPLRLPGEGEILVKVKACGVCHSDSTAIQGYLNDMYGLFISRAHPANQSFKGAANGH
jgi:D-arabinose 1-dehydrogenase-like Zn-dependent alcohol dehydrogenase